MSQGVLIAGPKIKFKCGCAFDKLDFDKVPLDCPATWDLICSGFTRGIFQLEGSLGKRFAKELKPRNINELSDLVSLIRPGCLEAEFREDPEKPGKWWSITSTYIKVKDGDVEAEYVHPVLEPIFRETYSVPVYQEQIMRICTDFAGFSLQEADKTRKAVGKKNEEVMKAVKAKFVEGAAKMGHPVELSETVFGWIDKFSGYGFNKSHAVSYAMIGYQTAYAKRHFPLQYFKAMLTHSEDKQDALDEVQALVHEAKLFDIKINPPCLKICNADFAVQDKNSIAFGLGHIKGVGKSSLSSIKKIAKMSSVNEIFEKSFKKGLKVKRNVMEALIKSGAMDYLGEDRLELIVKYKILCGLTDRERDSVFNQFIKEAFEPGDMMSAFNLLANSKVPRGATRKQKVKDLIADFKKELRGNTKRISIGYEKFFLGIPLSGSVVELHNNPYINIKCRQLNKLADGVQGCLGVVIDKVKKIKDKNLNEMCFLTVSDDTYLVEAVVFSSVYKNFSWIIEEGKPVLLTGKKSKGSFLVRKIEHL